MNTLTDAEARLACALLHEYRMNLLRMLRAAPEKSPLTAEGRERYWSDIALAEAAAEKLEPVVPRLRAVP